MQKSKQKCETFIWNAQLVCLIHTYIRIRISVLPQWQNRYTYNLSFCVVCVGVDSLLSFDLNRVYCVCALFDCHSILSHFDSSHAPAAGWSITMQHYYYYYYYYGEELQMRNADSMDGFAMDFVLSLLFSYHSSRWYNIFVFHYFSISNASLMLFFFSFFFSFCL